MIIEYNNIINAEYGLRPGRCTTCVINSNYISNISAVGILFHGSHLLNNVIKNNILSNSDTGILVYDSIQNLIFGNVMFDNRANFGIRNFAYHNNITYNIFIGDSNQVVDSTGHFNPNYWNKNL